MMFRFDKNALVYFNPRNGDKLRFAIGRYNKARVPELVDIKITDYCPFACSFCYQDSTANGAHASYENMQYIAVELGKNRVFEVALGGGEPTNHPDFIKILEDFRVAGVVPNFTTKSLGWVKRNWNQIEHTVGAFAFSAENTHDLEKAHIMLAGIPRQKVNIHYVMGLRPIEHYVSFMKKAHDLGFRVTLLGFKDVGRGKNISPYDYSAWIPVTRMLISVNRCPTISIDTPLAQEYEKSLPVSTKLFHTREGFVSAYIDAVKMGMSASSFNNEDLVPFDDQWVRRFATIEPV